MRILILDTIHGGGRIGEAYSQLGHTVDCIDVYRGSTPEIAEKSKHITYDLVVAPVHLDPANHFLSNRADSEPIVTHHEAVRRILGDDVPHPMIEITGSQGKTTTAYALAHILPGDGILHTSTGTYRMPQRELVFKRSIAPAYVLDAVKAARLIGGWLVAEESLGVTSAGDLSIITSSSDYRVAGGKKSAHDAKIISAQRSRYILLAPGISGTFLPDTVKVDDVTTVVGKKCTIAVNGTTKTFENPLLEVPGYSVPLTLAATAAMMLGYDPSVLSTFTGVPGRMSTRKVRDILVVDNANSGTNADTTIAAARYARSCSGLSEITLVIGSVKGDGAVCEGFPADEIERAVTTIKPVKVIFIGDRIKTENFAIDAYCTTFDEAEHRAIDITAAGSIIIAIKTWR